MRVMVSEIDGGHASTARAGGRLFALLGPALARGEEVVLDFDGVKHCSAPFWIESVGRLVEADADGRLPGLLRYDNARPSWRGLIDAVTQRAERRRACPAGAAAMDAVARQLFEED